MASKAKIEGFIEGYNAGFFAANPKWVDMNDRYPKDPGMYLTYNPETGTDIRVWDATTCQWLTMSEYESSLITFWMELPPPPTSEDEAWNQDT